MSADPVLEVRDLTVTVLNGPMLVDRAAFAVEAGEMLAVVGESGAGKSMLARAVLGLSTADVNATGDVVFQGRRLDPASTRDYRALYGHRLAYVPQDALAVLNPVHRVADQLALAARSLLGLDHRAARRRAETALEAVGIGPDRARCHPHEFSGGMRQRAVIAMAAIASPALIVADEPTTALDVIAEASILDILDGHRQRGAALVLITHDLSLVAAHAHRVAVMHRGRLVETGPVERVLGAPEHPYTASLLAAATPTPRED